MRAALGLCVLATDGFGHDLTAKFGGWRGGQAGGPPLGGPSCGLNPQPPAVNSEQRTQLKLFGCLLQSLGRTRHHRPSWLKQSTPLLKHLALLIYCRVRAREGRIQPGRNEASSLRQAIFLDTGGNRGSKETDFTRTSFMDGGRPLRRRHRIYR